MGKYILILFVVIMLCTMLVLIDARGGKVRWRVRFSFGRHFSGNKITSKNDVGSVYGASYWRIRSSSRSKGDLPEVCYNDKYDKNNLTNVSYVGLFICPTDDSMGDDHTYCCGDEGQQYCCTFWDDDWRVYQVVFGILWGLFVICIFSCVCYMYCFKKCKSK